MEKEGQENKKRKSSANTGFALSVKGEEAVMVEALGVEADDYITKPAA